MAVKVCPLQNLVAAQAMAYVTACLPEFVECDPNPDDGLIKDCADLWNQNYCATDKPFFMRYKHGDKIQFQVIFRDNYNDDKEFPVYGWNDWIIARLYNDDTGELLSDDVTDFCDGYWTGWNGKESIGTISVDTNLPIFADVNCWHLEFESRFVDDDENIVIDDEACSEPFCACANCDHWPLVSSDIGKYDGLGYWHGPVKEVVGTWFPFNPVYRMPIEIVQVGAGTVKQVSEIETLDIETRKIYRVGTIELVPPYVLNLMVMGFLSGLHVIIDGERYEADQTEVQRSNSESEMMWFNFDVYQVDKRKRNDC